MNTEKAVNKDAAGCTRKAQGFSADTSEGFGNIFIRAVVVDTRTIRMAGRMESYVPVKCHHSQHNKKLTR